MTKRNLDKLKKQTETAKIRKHIFYLMKVRQKHQHNSSIRNAVNLLIKDYQAKLPKPIHYA